jgi:peroxin-5
LWNRLGSALSNGSKPEEALGAYREALQLRPTYTRAIYNVGVACSYCSSVLRSVWLIRLFDAAGLNLGAHREAAEHFLSALAMQEATGGPSSIQVWTTLRRALVAMVGPPSNASIGSQADTQLHAQDRPDLANLAKPSDKSNLEVFRKEGFDFHT